jgi:hypothetical protein
MEAQAVPPSVQQRLLAALQKRIAEKQGKHPAPPSGH